MDQTKLAHQLFNLSKKIVYFTILYFYKFVVHTVSFVMALLLTKTRVLANRARNLCQIEVARFSSVNIYIYVFMYKRCKFIVDLY